MLHLLGGPGRLLVLSRLRSPNARVVCTSPGTVPRAVPRVPSRTGGVPAVLLNHGDGRRSGRQSLRNGLGNIAAADSFRARPASKTSSIPSRPCGAVEASEGGAHSDVECGERSPAFVRQEVPGSVPRRFGIERSQTRTHQPETEGTAFGAASRAPGGWGGCGTLLKLYNITKGDPGTTVSRFQTLLVPSGSKVVRIGVENEGTSDEVEDVHISNHRLFAMSFCVNSKIPKVARVTWISGGTAM